MKTRETTPGKTYSVHTSSGCTVSDKNGWSKTIDAPDGYFTAHAGEVTIDNDDAADVREVFKLAPYQKLRLLGVVGGNGGLPAGFKRVEYLQSDGGQYIAIPEIKPSSQQTVNGIFYAPRQGVETKLLFGGRNDWLNAAIAMTVHTAAEQGGAIDSNNGFAQFGNEAIAYDSSAFLEKIINVSIGQSGAFINGEQVASFAVQTFASVNYYCLFTVRTGYAGNTDSRIFNGRCYGFNITQEGKYILNLIPCVNTDTGDPCMFDLVSRQPFYNSGTGSFAVGLTLAQVRGLRLPAGGGKLTLSLPHEASIDRLAQAALERARANGWELTLQYAEADVPAGYRRLDFLESTGSQYIDTGIKADAGISAACVYYQSPEVLESATGPQYIFGCGADTGIFAFLGLHTASPSTLFYYKSTLTLRAERPAGKIACLCDATGMELNGTRYEFSSTAELTESFDNCKLFARGDGKFATWANAKAQVYSFSISRAGERQVDYVPCIAPNGMLGMYNKVDGTMQANAGTGAFIAGLATVDDVRKLWLPETGVPLTVSVPADTPDSAVAQLRKNNPTWQIAIQYRTDDNEN